MYYAIEMQETATVRVLSTRKQIASHCQVSLRTIDNWIAQKRIPVLRLGGCVRFDVTRVDEALRRFEVKEIAPFTKHSRRGEPKE